MEIHILQKGWQSRCRQGENPLKIAVVTETFFPYRGGSAKRAREVFKRLAAKGHAVHLYTARLRRDWPAEEEIDGIVVHRSKETYRGYITSDGFRSLRDVFGYTLWALRELKREAPFDLIEANHCPIFPAVGSWIRAKMWGTPLSVTFHEAWHREWYRYVPNRLYAPMGINLENVSTRLPDLAIAVSRTTADGLRSSFGMPEDRIRVISNGVDLELYGKNGVSREPEKIIFVGRLNPHKKVEWLLDAARALAKEHPRLKVDVVGDGPMAGFYRSYAESRGLNGRVKFLGAVEDDAAADALKRSSVYVLPSIREGQSITVLEAMAAGTPQVAVKFNGSAVGELLGQSSSGLSVAPSPNAIADGTRTLMDDGRLWGRMSENGLKFVSRYSWDRIADEHLREYARIASC